MTQRRLTGAETFHHFGTDAGDGADAATVPTVVDFWRWSMSDLLSNATRGLVAEFVVGSALGAVSGVRHEWDAVDLVTPDGVRVEVKSAAYVQSWEQTKPSTIQFSVAHTKAWIRETGKYEEESKRQADVYVFALLGQRESPQADPLDLGQWQFFVLATKQLDEALGDQQSLSLSRLEALGPRKVDYAGLTAAVAHASRRE